MDFTREPIIETVITPKDGWTLVVRSSKNAGQEEYFVDAVEVITFGGAVFFRSRERPKSFMVPVSDYEVLEVRETRLVLKNVGIDRSIKIGGGRDSSKGHKESASEKADKQPQPQNPIPIPQTPMPIEVEAPSASIASGDAESPQEASLEAKEARLDKRRERKRNYRRKRARDSVAFREEEGLGGEASAGEEGSNEDALQPVTSVISSLLPPPATLISETISRYKDNVLFKGAFFLKDEHQNVESVEEASGENQEIASDTHDKVFDDLLGVVEMPQMSLDFPVYEALGAKENVTIHAAERAEEAAGVAEAFVKAAQEAEVAENVDAIEETKADEEVAKTLSDNENVELSQQNKEDNHFSHSENADIIPYPEEASNFHESSESHGNEVVGGESQTFSLFEEDAFLQEPTKFVQAGESESHGLYQQEELFEDIDDAKAKAHDVEDSANALQSQEQLEWSFEQEEKAIKKQEEDA